MAKQVKHQHYVDNNKLEAKITKWVNDYCVCVSLDRKRPKISDSIGRDILKIINGLASRYNFSQYTYKEEMIGDAILHVCIYLPGFNRLKGSAFNFISFAAYHTFSARIKHEQRQAYYKNKNLQIISKTTGVTDSSGRFIDPGLAKLVNDTSSDFNEKISKYEDKYKTDRQRGIKPKPKAKTHGLFALAFEDD